MKNPSITEKDKRIIEIIGPDAKDKILVVGTGVFPKIEYFLYTMFKCKDIVSGDIDNRNIENGKKILPELDFIYLDAQEKFPLKDSFFDKVILTEVLEHLKDEDFALQEIWRVLKKGGKLIISVPKSRWFNIFSPITLVQHEREYNEKQLTGVLQKNKFKIEKIFVGGNIYDLLGLWIHLILKHFFHILHVDPFFEKHVENSYKKNSKVKGTDIFAKARK